MRGLEKGACDEGQPQRNTAFLGRQPSRLEDAVDDFLERPRVAIGDEVGLTGTGGARFEPVSGQEMGVGRVVDVDRVDEIRTISDKSQLAGPRPREKLRNEVCVPGAPDQMRPQGNRGEVGSVGRQHRHLGHCLGLRIGRPVVVRVRDRLVHPFETVAAVDHAR